MRLTTCLTFICSVQILSNANASKSKYTVIAPGTIYCNEKYTAVVAVHHTIQPCKIKIGITGPFYSYSKQIEVTQNELKNVEFILPCCVKGDLHLTAEGIECFDNFKNTTKLIYNKFKKHVIIQTDKDIYEPGDDINFRVLFLDKDFRPARPNHNALICIADGKGNRVKEIKGFKTIKGVYTGKFKISELPVTGGWHLGVWIDGGIARTVYFEVEKFDVPKFLVKVEAKKSVSIKDAEMQVIVRANYSYGKPLDGNATVVLNLKSYKNYEDLKPPELIKTANMVKGKAKFNLNVKEYEAYFPDNATLPFYATITARVEEQLTGVAVNGTTLTTIYPYRYFVKCINIDYFFTLKSDRGKDLLFQLSHVDGSYLRDTKSIIELIIKEVLHKNLRHRERTLHNIPMLQPLSENRTVSSKGYMNETGFVTFTIALPDLPHYEGYSHYYSLQIKYLDEEHEVCSNHLYWNQKKVDYPKGGEEKSKEYFILEVKYLPANKFYLKRASQFILNSSQTLSYFDYNVIGRGNILESGRINLPDKPKVYNLTLTPQFSWAPKFCVYVNYVDESGKYHYAEQSYKVVELENQINITVAKQVKPGAGVAVKIQTAPNSFVGLMAVDHTAFLYRTDNDFNFYDLNKVLGSYNTYIVPQGGYSKYPGEVSGCITFTNADYYYSRTQAKNIKRDVILDGNENASKYSITSAMGEANNMKARKNFLKTWFFTDIENTEVGEFIWPIQIPETLTSWALTAFSLNPQTGLGVTRDEVKITTLLPFSVSIRLPYSIKRGEVINVPVFMFNYLGKALDVEVTLHNSDYEYEFIEFDNKVIDEPKLPKNIRIPANGAAGVSFLLTPKVVGNVMLKFSTSSLVAGDIIHKTMKVVPEGITQYGNHAYFVNLNKEAKFNSSFALELPRDAVPYSKHMEVGVMGDILGPVLINLENLVRLPTRCGEHTISTLLTNYLIMKYLKDSERLTPNRESKLRCNLETGYQSILNYRHTDGSFSSFGPAEIKEKPHNGSTWLTAYVIRSLLQIKEFINVDGKIIDEGLDYLSKQQAVNGTFSEKGDYFYALQRNHITLTCTVVLAIMENPTYAEKYSEELSKGLNFIAKNIGKSYSLHALAIGTFTLNKAKHIAAKNAIYKFRALARTELNRIWWSEEEQCCDRRWWYDVFSHDIKITSYFLLTLLDQERTEIEDVLAMIKWLIAQRNSKGGFASTQDTVLGLTALIEFAKFADYDSAKMTVDIESQKQKETIKLSKDNGMLYQSIEMFPVIKSINFTAKGIGLAMLQIAYQYNVLDDPIPSFIIKTSKFYNKKTPLRLQMLVCVTYLYAEETSSMTLLEISTPSGYVVDDESLKQIKELRKVSSTELKYADTLLVVYFDNFYKSNETCFLFQAIRTHAVAMQKPASIVIYDYYNTGKRATAFYEVDSQLCDICETEEECSKCY